MTTPILTLPELVAAQSQPHVPLNTALRRLDAFGNISVISRTNTPPGSPAEGDRYIAGASPTGAWSGHADDVACYSGGAWIFLNPFEGLIAWNKGTAEMLIYGTQSPVTWDVLELGGTPPVMNGAKVSNTVGNLSVGDSTDFTVTYDTEVFDTGAMANLGTNNDRLTCTATGRYLIEGYACFDANATGTRYMYIMVNDTDLPGGALEIPAATGGLYTFMQMQVIAQLSNTDTIKLVVWQDSGGALDLLDGDPDGFPAYLTVQRIG